MLEEATSFEEFKGKSFEEVYRMYKRADTARRVFARIILLQIAVTAKDLKIVMEISNPHSPLYASAKERLELLESK
ncbi:MAG: hypothetical protein AAB394_03265 [Patescibacteria group bacterium]